MVSCILGSRHSEDAPVMCWALTLAAWGVQDEWTVLGFTPLALFLRHRAKRLFRLPLSPLGREPLHLNAQDGRHVKPQRTAESEDSYTEPPRLCVHAQIFIIYFVLFVFTWVMKHGDGGLFQLRANKRSETTADHLPDPQALCCVHREFSCIHSAPEQ